MNANQLKELQAPIKAKYKENAGAPLITLKAKGQLGEGVTCNVQTGKALVADTDAAAEQLDTLLRLTERYLWTRFLKARSRLRCRSNSQ